MEERFEKIENQMLQLALENYNLDIRLSKLEQEVKK